MTLADTWRLVALRGSEWVVRRGRLWEEAPKPPGGPAEGLPCFSPAGFIRDRVAARGKETVWVSAKGWRVTGLASACRRHGPTSWEVHNLVAMPDEEEGCAELLEVLASYAGERGAERLFLRLPEEWRLIELARRSGFFPCTQIVAFALVGRAALVGATPIQQYRERLPEDQLTLFRIYGAATPAEVRAGTGLTLQQWSDAQEPEGRRTAEFVVEQGPCLKAWVRLASHGKRVRVQTMTDPAWEGDLRDLVAFVLEQAGPRRLLWEVPAYQESLRLTLDRVGFQALTTYQLMVKSLAVRVKEPGMAPVSA